MSLVQMTNETGKEMGGERESTNVTVVIAKQCVHDFLNDFVLVIEANMHYMKQLKSV